MIAITAGILRHVQHLKSVVRFSLADHLDYLIHMCPCKVALIQVEESLKQNVPVLVLADSKGCADLIANGCLAVKPEYETFVIINTN